MSKRNKQKNVLMREWPTDETCGVDCQELIHPIRKIITEGYRVERLPSTQFTYAGYTIGKQEQLYFPTPAERFTTRWLANEAKFNRSLLDNALVAVFQLGIEQGRRLDKYNRYNNDILVDIINARTKTVKQLRARLSEYEETVQNTYDVPLECQDNDLLIESNAEELDTVDARNTKED